jgi:hypothetical protein
LLTVSLAENNENRYDVHQPDFNAFCHQQCKNFSGNLNVSGSHQRPKPNPIQCSYITNNQFQVAKTYDYVTDNRFPVAKTNHCIADNQFAAAKTKSLYD